MPRLNGATLTILPAMVLGIAIGWLLPRNDGGSPGLPNPAGSGERGRTDLGDRQAPDGHLSKRPRERIAEKKQPAGHIVLPAESVRKFLSKGGFLSGNFEELPEKIETVLILMGASEIEKQNVKDLFEQTRRDLHAAEKKLITIKTASSTKITLDMSRMAEASKTITDGTQGRIRSLLDPERAEALNSGINWSSYYPLGKKMETELEIYRKNGVLHKVDGNGTYRRETRLDPALFPDDGSPIPASRAFEADGSSRNPDRWRTLLEGRMLVPVKAEEDHAEG